MLFQTAIFFENVKKDFGYNVKEDFNNTFILVIGWGTSVGI
jgi:hypothetical protein